MTQIGGRAQQLGRASPTTRSSSTSACSTCSTAATCPRPATTRWRASTSTRSPCRCREGTLTQGPGEPVDRHLEHGVASEHAMRATATAAQTVRGELRAGLTSGHPARERGRRARRLEGLLQRLQAEGRRAVLAARPGPRAAAPDRGGVRHPDVPDSTRTRRDPARGPHPGLPDGRPGAEPARERQADRDAAAEHGRSPVHQRLLDGSA